MASNPYAALAAASAKPSGGGSHGISGFLDNLGSDVRDSAVGLPAGLVHMATHPVSSVEAMGKSTWQDWSPLLEGHVGKFAHNFYAHPLAPLLDAASVLTLGGSLAGSAASKAAELGMVEDGSKVAKLANFSKSSKMGFGKTDEAGNDLPEYAKHTSKNPVTKAAQLAIHKVVNDVSPHLPGWMGEAMTPAARYDRLEVKMMAPRAAALKYQMLSFVKAGKSLTGDEALANRRLVLEHSYSQMTHLGREWDTSKPLPQGWKYQKAEPGKVAGHDQAQSTFNMHAAKQKGIVSAYSKQHGVIITGRTHAAQLLKDTTQQLKKAQTNLQPYNHLRVRQEMLGNYLKKNTELTQAARVLNAKRAATATRAEKFFAPTKNGGIEQDLGTGPQGFANRYTTNDVTKAKLITNKSAVIVPKHTLDKFAYDGAQSGHFLKMLNSNPVRVWKMALQGYSPAFVTHTSVGNFFMYAMHHGGSAGFRGLMDAIGQVKGQPAIAHFFEKAGKDAALREHVLNPDFMDANFKDQLNNTLAHGADAKVSGKLYKYSMYPVMHAVGDQFFRRATINAELRNAPEVQALMKNGMEFKDAASKALSGSSGKARMASDDLRGRVSQAVSDTMGDYHSLNKGERGLAQIMPFYTWNRHALRFTKAAFRDDPGKLDVASKLSNQGVAETKKLLGNIPSYLLGSVPLSMLGIKGTGIAQTTSLNPLSTAPDVLDAVQSLVRNPKNIRPGESIGNELGPVLGGALQYLSGTNLQTGVPIKNKSIGGLPGSIISQTGSSLPWGSLIKKLISGDPQPKPNATTGKTQPFLFKKDKESNISSILGVPIKHMNKQAAEKAYDEQYHIKKGRTSKTDAAYAALSGG